MLEVLYGQRPDYINTEQFCCVQKRRIVCILKLADMQFLSNHGHSYQADESEPLYEIAVAEILRESNISSNHHTSYLILYE